MNYGVFHQCFDTVGWVTGRTCDPSKTCAHYSHRFPSGTNAGRNCEGTG